MLKTEIIYQCYKMSLLASSEEILEQVWSIKYEKSPWFFIYSFLSKEDYTKSNLKKSRLEPVCVACWRFYSTEADHILHASTNIANTSQLHEIAFSSSLVLFYSCNHILGSFSYWEIWIHNHKTMVSVVSLQHSKGSFNAIYLILHTKISTTIEN